MNRGHTSESTRKISLQEVQNLLRGNSDPGLAFSACRGRISAAQIPMVLRWLPNIRNRGRGVFAPRFPAKISDLRRGAWVFDTVSTELEVRWAVEIILSNADRINKFLESAHQFEKDLVVGRSELCGEVVSHIEKTCGMSLWTIESRMAYLQHFVGLESQKAYLSEVQKTRPRNDVVSFLAYYVSQRNEDTTVPLRFVNQFIETSNTWKIDPDFRAYLVFRVTNQFPEDLNLYAGVLRYEAPSALLDYYDTFVRLAQHAIISEPSKIGDVFADGLSRMAEAIVDVRIGKALYMADGSIEWIKEIPPRDLSPEDALLQGDSAGTLRGALSRTQNVPEDPTAWHLTAIGCSETGSIAFPEPSSGIGARIVNLLSLLLGMGGDRYEAILALQRLVLNWRLTKFSTALDAFVSQEVASGPVHQTWNQLAGLMDSPFLEPSLIRHLRDGSTYRELLERAYGSHLAIDAELMRLGAEDTQSFQPLSGDARCSILAQKALRENQNAFALEMATVLIKSSSPRIRRLGVRLTARALLAAQAISDLVELIVDSILQDEGLAQMLPVAECVNLFDPKIRKQCEDRLSTPILFSLASKYSGLPDASLLSDSYEDFLIANGMTKPSELRDRFSEFPRTQLVYFLREICVPSVMHLSTAFAASRELEDERIAICSLLTRIDDSNAKTYETEAREITRTQTIRQGVRRAEQSKIYVDTDAIGRLAEGYLKEKFTRYQTLLAAGVGSEDSAFTDAFKELILSGKPLPKEFLEVPKNESYSLLTDMVSTLLYEFTLSATHGLDCYLSMRIRHGTLSGQLRSPLEEQQLITQRESGSQEYKPNDYWPVRLPYFSQEGRNEIVNRLSDFSRSYDDFIDRIANKLIQIRSKDKPEGLFDVHQTGAQLRLIGSKIKSDSSFERFVELCFENFWVSVEVCLRAVRQAVDQDLKVQVSEMFGKLETDIAEIANGHSTAELDGAIRTARTRAQIALDRVKDWFELSKPLEEPDFTLEQLVEIGLQMVRNVHREFDPLVSKVILDLPPFGWALTFFTDVFFIIFDNIRRHSGIHNQPTVEVDAESTGDKLRIVVRSEISPAVRTSEAEERIANIKRALNADLYSRSVSSEGGSGFIKLGKLVRHDGRGTLDFGFGENDRFVVDFELPLTTRKETTYESADRRR